jgi:hypothetical protein
MKEVIEKISNYNFFNYLLPGIIFTNIADKFTTYIFLENNLVIAVFTYYFIGLVISRFGSLVIEPILIRSMFVKYTSYKKFIAASKQDEKIELLTESNNMYRTFVSVFSGLLFLKICELLQFKILEGHESKIYIILVILLIVFLLAYRKQTSYITKRIKAVTKNI